MDLSWQNFLGGRHLSSAVQPRSLYGDGERQPSFYVPRRKPPFHSMGDIEIGLDFFLSYSLHSGTIPATPYLGALSFWARRRSWRGRSLFACDRFIASTIRFPSLFFSRQSKPGDRPISLPFSLKGKWTARAFVPQIFVAHL